MQQRRKQKAMNWKRKQNSKYTKQETLQTVFLVTAEDLRRKEYIHFNQRLQIEVNEIHRLGIGLGGALKDLRLDLRYRDLTGLDYLGLGHVIKSRLDWDLKLLSVHLRLCLVSS